MKRLPVKRLLEAVSAPSVDLLSPAAEELRDTDDDPNEPIGPPQAFEQILMRYEWYRDKFRISMKLNMVQAIALACLVFVCIYLYTHIPAPKYFATSADGRITELTPMDQANLSDRKLLQWAVDAVGAANDYNFENYRGAIQGACNDYFTRFGCESYKKALIATGNLNAVKKKRLVASAQVVRAPVITEFGVARKEGWYFWNVELVAKVTYQSSAEFSTQRLVIQLNIVRMSPLESARGIGVHQYIAQVAGSKA